MMLLLYRIATTPCLRYFDPDLETFIYTDASLFGLGGWIGQKHADGIHPIMFWSRKLIAAEIKYHTHEREFFTLNGRTNWRLPTSKLGGVLGLTAHVCSSKPRYKKRRKPPFLLLSILNKRSSIIYSFPLPVSISVRLN
jgi:hypothetical protein